MTIIATRSHPGVGRLRALGDRVFALAADPTAPELAAARPAAKYDSIKDFSADFVHTYEGGVLRKNDHRARPPARQEAGQDAVGLLGAGGEARSCPTA